MIVDKEANAKFNKTNPGPEFTSTWKSFVKEDANPTESKGSRKTVKDIEQQGERSTSGISRWWAGFTSTGKAEGEFTILDRNAHIGEVVQAANPKLWAEVEKAYHDAKAKVDKAE